MHYVNTLYCKQDMPPSTPSNATQCNTIRLDMRTGPNSIFESAVLRLTNQFSEFYHNTQGKALHHYVNPALGIMLL